MTAPTQDGFGSANLSSGSPSVAVTTTGANRILVAIVKQTGGAAGVVTISDTSGLTWTRVFDTTWNTTASGSIGLWWALMPSAGTTTVTATCGSNAGPRITVIGIAGANTTTPFDTNASLGSSSLVASGGTSVTTLATNAISTNNANCLLIACLVGVNGGNSLGTVTEPSGFASAGSSGAIMDVALKGVTSTQSSVIETYSWVTTGQAVVFVTAVQAPGGAAFTWQDLGPLSLPQRSVLEVVAY